MLQEFKDKMYIKDDKGTEEGKLYWHCMVDLVEIGYTASARDA